MIKIEAVKPQPTAKQNIKEKRKSRIIKESCSSQLKKKIRDNIKAAAPCLVSNKSHSDTSKERRIW